MTTARADADPSKIELRRKRQILRVVAAVVAEEGFAGATMRRIAERAGVSTGMLTYYYKSKRELLIDMLSNAYERTGHNVEEATGHEGGELRIQATFEQMLEGSRSHVFPLRFWIAYWAEAARDEELRRFSLRSPIRDIFRKSIQEAVLAGDLRADLDPDLAADLLNMVWQGARVEVGLYELEESRVSGALRLLLESWSATGTTDRASPSETPLEA